jgi:C-terminal processing protease CtpA/Prc
LGGVVSTWDITVLPTADHFEIGGVWGDNQHIEFGDIVTHIDGKSLKDFPKDQYEIERLMEDIQGDTSTVTLLKNGKEQIVPIRRVY